MSMFHFTSCSFQQSLVLSTAILVAIFSIMGATGASNIHPKAMILPITKDPKTLQYITQIEQRTPPVNVSLVLDIGGVYLWTNCETDYISSSYKSARCGSAQCHLFKSRKCNGPCYLNVSKPGCNDDSCDVNVYNPVTRISTGGEVTMDLLTINSIHDQRITLSRFPFTCTPSFLIDGLTKGARGMAGLGRGRMGMPELLASQLSLRRRFGVCLGAKGAILIGDVAYKSSGSLTYTPLILNPVYTAGIRYVEDPSTDYFIGVKSIKINDITLKLNSTLLKISADGNGGTRLSTIDHYTILESSIYHTVASIFEVEANRTSVAPVSPFGLCYAAETFRKTSTGPDVPRIDLVLQSTEVKWSIIGANSMVKVSDEVMCLGVVDGGMSTGSGPMASIVIGGHMLENVLMEFDLADSRLGFSSSLLDRGTTCSDFDHTSIIA